MTFPHAKTVLAIRGSALWVGPLHTIAGAFLTFDEITKFLPAAMMQTLPQMATLIGDDDVEVVVLGWSPAARRMRLFLAKRGNQFEPEFAPIVTAPDLDLGQLAQLGLAGRDGGMRFRDPPHDLLKMMHLQREIAAAIPAGDPRAGIVGGHAVLTQVSEHTISQRILFVAWQDVVGEPVAGAA